MLTRAEKTYLALTLAFLGAGSGIKAWRHATVKLGPFPDPATLAQDSARTADSLAAADSLSPADPGTGPGDTASTTDALYASRGAEALNPPLSAWNEQPRPDGAGVRPPPDRHEGKSRAEPGPAGKIDLNRADAASLMRVPGIGAKTAAAILAWRRAHGPFRDLRDLLNIKGIGDKKLEKLGPHILL
jgi:competence ComEA-like helix-hairpin-helix protein